MNSSLFHVLAGLAVVILVTRVVGISLQRFRQPMVIGEVLGGILLGPSFLGKVAPNLSEWILPTSNAPFFNVIAQMGIILYMFLVGLEMDISEIKKSSRAAIVISQTSILIPFFFGIALSFWIFESMAPPGIQFLHFSLFIGIAMSITAFPVLARILSDLKIQKTSLGVLALTAAAVGDVTAWCLLAAVTGLVGASSTSAVTTLIFSVAYVAFLFLVLRPFLQKLTNLLDRKPDISENHLAFIFFLLLASAVFTEAIGIHAIFGAFLLGVVTSSKSRIAEVLVGRFQDMVRVLFLPAFFAYTGMRTEIGLIHTAHDWFVCGSILCLAILGKFVGTMTGARFMKLDWKNSTGIGILMNTRGMVELIVLNVGLDLKILSPSLFTMFVIMALITTFITGPLFQGLKLKLS